MRTADECLYRSKQAGRNRTTGGRDRRRRAARAADRRDGPTNWPGTAPGRSADLAQLRVDRLQLFLHLTHQAVDLAQ